MKLRIIFFFVVLSSFVYGQKSIFYASRFPFEPVEFENMNPKWTLPIFDSLYYDGKSFNGYNVFGNKFVKGDKIQNGKLYKMHTIYIADYMGFKVSCIDIETGKLEWGKVIRYEDYDRQLTPAYQTFDKDGNLLIIGYRQSEPYDPKKWTWDFVQKCKFFHMVLDSKDGSILSYASPEENPEYNINEYGHFQATDFYGVDEKGRVEFVQIKEYYEKPDYVKTIYKGFIDVHGTSITDSTVYRNFSHYTFLKRNNQYYNYFYSSPSRNNLKYLITLDSNLREVSRIDMKGIIPENGLLYPIMNTEEYMVFVMQITRNVTEYSYNYIVMDYQGNLLNQFYVDDEDIKKYNNPYVGYDVLENKVLMIGDSYTSDRGKKEYKSSLDVIHYYEGANYKLYKRIVNKKNRHVWLLDNLGMDKDNYIFEVPCNVYFYDDVTGDLRISRGDISVTMMRISKEELGMKPTRVNDDITARRILAYPNPTSGIFKLSLEGIVGSKDILVYDVYGHNVYEERGITEDTTVDVNLTGFPSGKYIYQVYEGNKIVGSGKCVKY